MPTTDTQQSNSSTTGGVTTTTTTYLRTTCTVHVVQSYLNCSLVVIGDSLSTGEGTWLNPYFLANYNGGDITLHNYSSSGTKVEDDMADMVASAEADDADLIIILLGTNDGNNITQNTYQTCLETLKSDHPGARIYALGILPCTAGASSGVGVRDTVNSRISAAVSAAGGVTYVNTDGWIDATYPPAGDTVDGLHLSYAGAEKVSNELCEVV